MIAIQAESEQNVFCDKGAMIIHTNSNRQINYSATGKKLMNELKGSADRDLFSMEI